MCFRGHLTRWAVVAARIESEAAVRRGHITDRRSWWRVGQCRLGPVTQEAFGNLLAQFAACFATFRSRRITFGDKCAFELMVSRGGVQQLVDGRWCVVDRQVVDPEHV